MTALLEQAFAEVAKLPSAQQDLLASWILAEIAVENDFDRAIARTSDKLAVLATEAIAQDDAERTRQRYKVALYESEEGFSAVVPGLPGCCTQGATEEEALANVAIAIREYLEVASELADEAKSREVEVAV